MKFIVGTALIRESSEQAFVHLIRFGVQGSSKRDVHRHQSGLPIHEETEIWQVRHSRRLGQLLW